jgi:lipid-A-disaccharide synthase
VKYYIIAGEASGDLHAANLMKELRRGDPAAEFRCWGGDLMKEQGGVLVRHYRDLAFMGFVEVLLHLKTISDNIRFCRKDILAFSPDALILVDYPGFNLRIARFARSRGIKVFYYISPQLWAWRSSRVKIIKENVDRMFVILPFEKAFYASHGYPVDFVGHPLLDKIHPGMAVDDRATFLGSLSMPDKPLIALLPGSRRQEIRKMLRTMLGVIPRFPEYQFVVAGAPSIPPEFYQKVTKFFPVKVVFGNTYALLRHSVAALVTSGTATLETALMDVPQVVVYKGSRLSYLLARQVVHVRFISLVNLILDREVVRELIQDKLTTGNLVAGLKRILSDESCRKQIHADYNLLREMLGGPGASAKAAGMMLDHLKEKEIDTKN